MGSEELGANIFRATQADAKMKRDNVSTKGQANITHYRVGQEVREAIKHPGTAEGRETTIEARTTTTTARRIGESHGVA